MSIINRYILRQLFLNFIILMVVVVALYVSVDLIVNLDYYLNAAKAWAKREDIVLAWAFLKVMVDFYVPMCMLMYVYLSGIVVVAAVGFTVVSLQRTRELTAVVASGVSLRRIAFLLFWASLFLNCLAVPVQQWLLPPLAYKAMRSRKDLVQASNTRDPVKLMPVNSHNDLLSAEVFNMKAGVLEGIHLMERDGDGDRLLDVRADKATWNAAQKAWLFEPAAVSIKHTKGSFSVAQIESLSQWKTDVSPKVIHAYQDGQYARLLSLGEMNELAQASTLSADFRDSLRQAWWSRFAMPLFNALLTLMTLPFFLSRIPVITPKQGLAAVGFCLTAWVSGLLVLNSQALPPAIAVWSPVLAFVGLSWWRLNKIET